MAKKKKEEEVKEEPQEEVQQFDLTELINYVNYLGEKLEEVSQSVQHPNVRFGMDVLETEGQLANSKYFHTVLIDNLCTDINKNMKEFYAKKYGAIPEVPKVDFYAF